MATKQPNTGADGAPKNGANVATTTKPEIKPDEKPDVTAQLAKAKAELAAKQAQIELAKVKAESAAATAELTKLGVSGTDAVAEYEKGNSNDADTAKPEFKYIAKTVRKDYAGRKKELPEWDDIPGGA